MNIDKSKIDLLLNHLNNLRELQAKETDFAVANVFRIKINEVEFVLKMLGIEVD